MIKTTCGRGGVSITCLTHYVTWVERSGRNCFDLVYWLGRMYEEGVDGSHNPQQACNCYRKAQVLFEKEYESGSVYHRTPDREKFRYHQQIKNDIQRRLAPFL